MAENEESKKESKEADKKEEMSGEKGGQDRTVREGDVCCAHYTGKLDSGEVFDTSKNREPIEFVVGSGQLIKGFDTAVVGMKKGEKKDIKLEPSEAYGDRDEKRIQKVPRDMLPKEQEPKEGMMLTITTPQGQMIPAKITKVDEKEVSLDMNHPLAGKNLNFEIEVVDIKDKPKESEAGCACCQ